MVLKMSLFVLACAVALPAAAADPDPDMLAQRAPDAPANARYCLKVEAVTGTRLESVQCHTRDEWAAMDVDLDLEWREEGVRILA